MTDDDRPEVRRVLREAVLEQVANNDPPETALTLERLKREGFSADEAVRWISAALLQELNAMVRDNRFFDRDAYASALNQLPKLIER